MKHLPKKLYLKKVFTYILFLGIAYLTFTNKIVAQENGNGSSILDNIYYGGKFGTTISRFTNQQPHTNVKQGITVGAFWGYDLRDNLAFQLELNYFQEGGQLLSIEHSSDLNNPSWIETKIDNQNLTLHNLDIPIMITYAYSLEASKIFITLGPALGININSWVKHETTILTEIGNTSTYTSTENITSNIERYNIGITLGFGIDIPILTNNYILIDARYKYGLTPVYKEYSYRGLPQITGDLKNNSICFTIGFRF